MGIGTQLVKNGPTGTTLIEQSLCTKVEDLLYINALIKL